MSRQLGHVFGPVWHAASGALFGFRASPRLQGGTTPADAFAVARETGDLSALGELSLLSALRESWNLPGRLIVRIEPTPDFTCTLPADTLLRPRGAIVAELRLSAHVQTDALRHTADVLRRQGCSFALSGQDLPSLGAALADLQPAIVMLDHAQWSEADALHLIDRSHRAQALVLCSGVDQPGQIETLRRSGCALVAGRHVGRPAPAAAWTPARISVSWPPEASR